MAGYSFTPLAKKMGIRENFKMKIINAPEYYFELFDELPLNAKVIKEKTIKKDFIHLFIKHLTDLEANITEAKNEIEQNGIIWVSWYKKSAKIPTDVTEDKIREIALANGLVDIKVCAVDDIWSGLKLVIPVKQRKRSV